MTASAPSLLLPHPGPGTPGTGPPTPPPPTRGTRPEEAATRGRDPGAPTPKGGRGGQPGAPGAPCFEAGTDVTVVQKARAGATASLQAIARVNRSGHIISASGATRPCRSDRKSTRLNSSHSSISYAVFC